MLSILAPSPTEKSKNGNLLMANSSEKKELSRVLINRIIHLKDESGSMLIQKFNIETILSNIEKHQIEIVELFSKYLKDGFNLLQFIRFFLNIIPHTHIENLYLTIGLIDLFREITLQTHKEKIILKDITDFMCDKILKNNPSFNKIEAKFLPFNKFVTPNLERKLFLQIPPTIYGQTNDKTHKLSQKCIKTDSSKHSRAIIKQLDDNIRSQFSFDLKKVFVLDSLSESISVYDENCILHKKISPVLTKLKKEVIILSFAFSKRQYRIGAVLKDFSIKFWDHFNDFQYQKSISTTSLCQHLQTNIYFLEYFNAWITTDKTGTLYLWNLLEQRPSRQLKCKYNTGINDICEIPSLNVIVVVQQCKRISKILTQSHDKIESSVMDATVVVYNFFNGHIITEIDLSGQRIPHTILYSETYQVLFMSGLEKRIKIYELHPRFMDASLKGELIGHENLITSFTLIKDTPMLVSADDKGKVKVWDFRIFTCIQTIDFSDKTIITNLLDMIEIGKIGVFGSRVNYIEFEDKYEIIKKRNEVENIKIEWIDFDQNLMEMYVFANKTLRVIDLHNGRIKHIFSFKFSPNDDQITVFRYFSCLKKFVLGNTKGEVQIFNPKTCELQSSLHQSHQGALTFIEFDELNKIYITVGYDSKILIHQASDGNMLRQLKNSFNGKEITCMEVSVYHNLLIIGSNSSNSIFCWNYEYGKLIGEIKLLKDETPVSLQVINGYSLLIVATLSHNIYLFKMNLFGSDLQLDLIDKLHLPFSILNAYADIKLKGKGKSTLCQYCKIIACCQNGTIMQYDILETMKKIPFKLHCKQKSNYNPYRESKESFSSQLQKIKHCIFSVQNLDSKVSSQSIWKEETSFNTEFNTICFSKLIKLQKTLNLTIGNERRIKIWSEEHELLCDYNISYCLPYKWDFSPSSASLTTEKVYFGIKIIESIVKKYENDISIGEAKNIEIRELFNYIEKHESDKANQNRIKMITQPDNFQIQGQNIKSNDIMLLQNEYSRKDLNFELVKRFNFTEIGGPTLKELDNIKKMEMLQRQWKIKEGREEREKEQLLKNIETKAKKNQEKDHIQFVLIKHKKYQPKEVIVQNEKVANLAKKLNAIETKSSTIEDKRMMTTFNKNFFRIPTRVEAEYKSSSPEQHLSRCQTKSRVKKSFEQYYSIKHYQDLSSVGQMKDQREYKFRDILTEMNGRVKSIKKHRYRREINKQTL